MLKNSIESAAKFLQEGESDEVAAVSKGVWLTRGAGLMPYDVAPFVKALAKNNLHEQRPDTSKVAQAQRFLDFYGKVSVNGTNQSDRKKVVAELVKQGNYDEVVTIDQMAPMTDYGPSFTHEYMYGKDG